MSTILILSTSTGYGHNQAAEAAKTILEEKHKVHIHDFLENKSIITSSVKGGYELFANKLSFLYGIGYKISNTRIINPLASFYFTSDKKRLLNKINDIKPDLIISTHPLAVSLISSLKKNGSIDTPLCSIITDFKAHSTYVASNIDSYIVGLPETKESLIFKGIDHQKIHILGIPVRDQFYNNSPVCKNFNQGPLSVLIMGGGMGLSNINSILHKVIKNSHELKITVVCGNNTDLKDSLIEEFNSTPLENKQIEILGFVNNISEIMNMSHIIITKPGGLTTTESIMCNIPMLIPFIIPGQESENRSILISRGCALKTSKSTINDTIDCLIKSPEKLETMSKNMHDIAETYNSKALLEIIDNLL